MKPPPAAKASQHPASSEEQHTSPRRSSPCRAVQHKQEWLTTKRPVLEKCSRRGCPGTTNKAKPKTCAAAECPRVIHEDCFKISHATWNMGDVVGTSLFCSKKCYQKFLKEQTTRPGWTNDSSGNEKDGNQTSADILMDWWMEPGNYAKFRGKGNNGTRKLAYAERLAIKMNDAHVKVRRDAKQVLNKIKHIEDQFRRAHDFANTETGAGILENDGQKTFADAVTKICPYYYDIHDLMADRASAKPKATNYDDDDDEEIQKLEAELEEGKMEQEDSVGRQMTKRNNSNSSSTCCSETSPPVVVRVIENQNQGKKGSDIDNDDGDISINSGDQKPAAKKNNVSNKTPSKRKRFPISRTGGVGAAASNKIQLLDGQTKQKLDDIYAHRLTKEAVDTRMAKVKSLSELRKLYPDVSKADIRFMFPEFEDIIDVFWKEE